MAEEKTYKDVEKLIEAQRIANAAQREGGEITKNLGKLLDLQVQRALKYKDISAETNNIIQNRTKTIQSIAQIGNKTLKSQEKYKLLQQNIGKTESKLAEARVKDAMTGKRKGSFQAGYNLHVEKALKSDLKSLKVGEATLRTQAKREEIIEGLTEKAKKLKNALTIGAVVGIFASLAAVTIKFGQKLDEIGNTFGSLNVMGSEFQDTLISQGNSVTALGFGVQDVANITNTLASNFGMNVDEASKLSGKVLDTGKALGLSADEASNLFGTLMTVGGLTAKQTEELTEGAFQLARQAGVAPAQVMKDIAGSAETVALFTKDGGKNLLEAAISARQLGISIDSVAKSARGVLNFEESIAKEVTASALTGRQIDLSKARQLSFNKDIAGYNEEITKQIQAQGDFGAMSVFEQEALADLFNMNVAEVSRISQGLEDVSIKGALAANSFEGLVGRDSMSNISSLIGSFKQLGAILTDALGKGLEDSIGGLKDFLANTKNLDKLKASFTEIGQKIGEMVTSFSEFLTNSGGITAMASGVMAFANGISKAVGMLPLLIGGLVAAKAAAITFSIGASLATLLTGGLSGGAIGIAATIAAVVAGMGTFAALTPKAQTGITGFGGGNLMVGESGPEIMNVPRGTNVTGAETTRQMMGGNDNKDVVNEQKRTNEGIATLTSAITNLNITAGRGTLKVAMEPALGGRGL